MTNDEFVAAWLSFEPFVRGTARGMTREPDDLVQDTALVFLTNLDRLHAAHFGGLCYAIMRQLRGKEARRHRNSRQHVLWDSPDTEHLALPVRETEPALERAIAGLRGKTRKALLLVDGAGYTLPEAAAELGLHYRALEGRLRRGRQAVRKALA